MIIEEVAVAARKSTAELFNFRLEKIEDILPVSLCGFNMNYFAAFSQKARTSSYEDDAN